MPLDRSAGTDLLKNSLASGFAGFLQPCLFNPLDVLRLRFQTARDVDCSLADFTKRILASEGTIRGLYLPGLAVNIAAVSLTQGLRMGVYPDVRDVITSSFEVMPLSGESSGGDSGNGGGSGSNSLGSGASSGGSNTQSRRITRGGDDKAAKEGRKRERQSQRAKAEKKHEKKHSARTQPEQGLEEDLLCEGARWVSAGSMRDAQGLSAPGPRPPAWPTHVWHTPATREWGEVDWVPPLVCA